MKSVSISTAEANNMYSNHKKKMALKKKQSRMFRVCHTICKLTNHSLSHNNSSLFSNLKIKGHLQIKGQNLKSKITLHKCKRMSYNKTTLIRWNKFNKIPQLMDHQTSLISPLKPPSIPYKPCRLRKFRTLN